MRGPRAQVRFFGSRPRDQQVILRYLFPGVNQRVQPLDRFQPADEQEERAQVRPRTGSLPVAVHAFDEMGKLCERARKAGRPSRLGAKAAWRMERTKVAGGAI